MGALGEAWRGGSTLLQYLLVVPRLGFRARAGANREELRTLAKAAGLHALQRCGIQAQLDGQGPPAGRGAVLVYNEASFADSFAYNAVFWDHVDRGAAAEIFTLLPFARAAFAAMGIWVVPRGDRAATERIVAEAVAAARAGQRVAWGGEGRQSGMDGVLRFKVGGALIAIRAGVPAYPVAFRGAHDVFPLGSLRARPGVIRVRIGEPLSTAGLTEDDARSLADRLQARVAEMYNALPPGIEKPSH